jgi:hypothetical protein
MKTSKTSQEVLLAPVPCIHLASATTIPELKQRVAFGTSQHGIVDVPIGLPVFIYASRPGQPRHPLYRGSFASWIGVLRAIVSANETGRRSGKHPDPLVRPPSTEALKDGDGPFLFFWEVEGLHQIEKPYLSLSKFKWRGGGSVPQWPVLAELDC